MSRHLIRMGDRVMQSITSHNIPGLRWLIDGFNFYDVQRVKEVGADRAAAEWVVRCGGAVKFDRFKDRFDDYNMLIRATAELDPAKSSDSCHLLEIDATNSCVSGYGCRHFAGLDRLSSVRFVNCKNLQDFGLETVGEHVGRSLPELHLESCRRITEFGLKHVEKFSGLKRLVIRDLPHVYKPERSREALKKALPNCDVQFD
ncbi:ATP synthase subunit s, mitochondrial [Aphelenchoides fujianensis]|nr:ATP synthase subunit s, mitochondrial [Aphelenchoides fujianensis]